MTLPPALHQEVSQVIRPAAVLEEALAVRLLAVLHAEDVSRGGTWNATSSLWQRFDTAWNGPGGTRGTSQLVGSLAVQYDTPVRRAITTHGGHVGFHEKGAELPWYVGRAVRLFDSV